MTTPRTFKLYGCCLPVKGARRSLLCDLQKQRRRFIPNSLYEILTEHKDKDIDAVKAHYDHQYDDVIEEYFEHLLAEDWGFLCDDDPALFPEVDLRWENPSLIANAIIDADAESDHPYESIFAQLDDLGCHAVQLRFFFPVPEAVLRRPLDLTARGGLSAIYLVLGHHPDIGGKSAYEALLGEYPRVLQALVHSAPEELTGDPFDKGDKAVLAPNPIDSADCCGVVDEVYFSVNLEMAAESLKYNSCLNRKISVDPRGAIKNCPSLPETFGRVQDSSLHSALAHKGFKDLWEINKDQIEVCKDCEFRYVCTDCRAFITDPDNRFSKPSKCAYDPYTAEWRV